MGQPDINIIIISFSLVYLLLVGIIISIAGKLRAHKRKVEFLLENNGHNSNSDAIIARTRTEIQEQDFKTFRGNCTTTSANCFRGQDATEYDQQNPKTQRMPESQRIGWFDFRSVITNPHVVKIAQPRVHLYSMAWSDPYKPRLTDSTACIFSTRCSRSTVRLPPSIPIAKSCSSAWCRKPCPMSSNTHGLPSQIVIHFGADQIDISIEDNGIGIHQINQGSGIGISISIPGPTSFGR